MNKDKTDTTCPYYRQIKLIELLLDEMLLLQELKYKTSRISTVLSHLVLPPNCTGNVLIFLTIFL